MGASLPSRSIGGDFFDFIDTSRRQLRLRRRRRVGQGPGGGAADGEDPGALQRAARTRARPRETIRIVNRGLTRRAVEAKYATVFHATLNATRPAHLLQRRPQPAAALRPGGLRRLDSGSMPVGLLRARALRGCRPSSCSRATCSSSTATASPRRSTSHGQEFGEERLVTHPQGASHRGRRGDSRGHRRGRAGLRARRRAVRRCDGAGREVLLVADELRVAAFASSVLLAWPLAFVTWNVVFDRQVCAGRACRTCSPRAAVAAISHARRCRCSDRSIDEAFQPARARRGAIAPRSGRRSSSPAAGGPSLAGPSRSRPSSRIDALLA